MALVLMRHPAPAVAPGTCYGASDIGLAEPVSIHDFPALPRFDRLVSSPLQRCRLAAEAIGARRGLQLTLDARLVEMDFGIWEGRLWADIPRAEIDAWARDLCMARPHGGETVAELSLRVATAIDAYRGSVGDTLIVTHAGVIRAALQSWSLEIAFGGWITID
jgi:alpha-ribazole phosphatase